MSTEPGDDGNGIEREFSTVTVRVAEEDMDAAQALGWTDGAVPDVEVVLARETLAGRIADSTVATTDESGVAQFEGLISATYRITALRLLDEEEVDLVEDEFPTLRAFGGGGKITVGTEPLETIFELQRNRTDGLVISEHSFTVPVQSQPGGEYRFFGYLEVYNNSDQAIPLDGKMIVMGFPHGHANTGQVRVCATTRQAANDPEGVWGYYFERFPGGGGEHLLQPGETAVIATDAIDHTEVASVFLDLTSADFEFHGSSDVDNPDVPNMVNNGFSEWFMGHGLIFGPAWDVPTLVEDVPIESLVRDRVDVSNDLRYARFPAENVLDVFSWGTELTIIEREFCADMVHDRFDGLDLLLPAGKSEPPGPLMSQQRRVVGTAPGGWPIVLDTNTSAVDFVTIERTAGSLPPQE